MSKKADFQKAWWMPAVTQFLELSGWIAVPAIGALIGAQYFTRASIHWGFKVLLILGCAGLSALGMYTTAKRYGYTRKK